MSSCDMLKYDYGSPLTGLREMRSEWYALHRGLFMAPVDRISLILLRLSFIKPLSYEVYKRLAIVASVRLSGNANMTVASLLRRKGDYCGDYFRGLWTNKIKGEIVGWHTDIEYQPPIMRGKSGEEAGECSICGCIDYLDQMHWWKFPEETTSGDISVRRIKMFTTCSRKQCMRQSAIFSAAGRHIVEVKKEIRRYQNEKCNQNNKGTA